MKRQCIAALLLLVASSVGFADVPVRTEQLIYSVLAFNRKDYSATFAAATSDTIYLLAGADNFLSARKTLVYFWPLSGEWKLDSNNLNVFFPGTLELSQGKAIIERIPMEWFTFFNVRGDYELNWKVAVGEAAQREYERYESLYAEYSRATADYKAKDAAYKAEVESLAATIQKLREEQRDFTSALGKLKTLPKPRQPQPPRDYVVPPSPPQLAFRLNLPRGEYRIRLINPDGTLMEGSDKTIVAHERRRSNGIGFELIPSDKWTRPEESKTSSEVVYVNGRTDLYMRAFYEDEFNDLDYAKTVANEAKGNPNIYEWVRLEQVPHATVELRTGNGILSRLTERPYYVDQTRGATLGYTIVPFNGQGAQKDKEPNLIAFQVPIGSGERVLGLRVLDAEGRPLPGSERQLRIVQGPRAPLLFMLLSLTPILVMGFVLGVRARVYSAQRAAD